jgi:hypothetical protein
MVLNNFLDRFIFTSQLKFKDFNFYLMDIPFVIVPVDVLLGLGMMDNPDINKAIYYGFKQSSTKNLMPKFKVDADKHKFLDLAQNFFAASGWGVCKNLEIDETNHRALITLSFSPLARELQGKVKHPADHYFRGVIAAMFSIYFGVEVEALESNCRANSQTDCTFVIKPLPEFDFSKEETQRQLSIDAIP